MIIIHLVWNDYKNNVHSYIIYKTYDNIALYLTITN